MFIVLKRRDTVIRWGRGKYKVSEEAQGWEAFSKCLFCYHFKGLWGAVGVLAIWYQVLGDEGR